MIAQQSLDGSSLCLACGLCCNGVLYGHAVIKPDEILLVRELGLTVEQHKDGLSFRLPCPLYQDHRCSIYMATRPNICGAYQCALLKKYLAGEVTLEGGVRIVERAKAFMADVVTQLPAGCSYDGLRRELHEHWDSGHGWLGSPQSRQAHAPFLLAYTRLSRYVQKHFTNPEAVKSK